MLAKSVEECLYLLGRFEVNIMSLDHDLGTGQPTGYDLVQKMVELGYYANEIYLHSSSAIGRLNMYQLLQQHKPKHVKVYPFPMSPDVMERALAGGNEIDQST